MSAVIYDTLKLARSLEGAFTPEQAVALAEALAGSTQDTIATKSDLAILKSDLEIQISKLEVKINDVKSELIRWIVGAITLNLFCTAGLVITRTRLLAH